MIRSIRHKGLKRLYEDDDPRGVLREHAVKLRDILARLEAATTVADMDLPGFRLHPLKGELKGSWAVTVRANWRVISVLPRARRSTLIMPITTKGVQGCR
jgi:proteic killer suppression protein